MQIIYYEQAVKDHPRTQAIIEKTGHRATLIECERYQEVFNIKSQNFRIQKKSPALILARKHENRILPTPEGFGIGGHVNYYFSHMLNCIYDCRYCFLQGMYSSAHYVLFVNYEDFGSDIVAIMNETKKNPVYFFSGYDCDSLAFDKLTGFLDFAIPLFVKIPQAFLELRTKNANISSLLSHGVIPNCIVAFSFTPQAISQEIEHGVPSVEKRLQAIIKLADKGWKIGLRFDPLIAWENFSQHYLGLITDIFNKIPSTAIHSVSIGPLRFPQKIYQKMVKLYPHDPLLAQPLVKRDQHYSYEETMEKQMKAIIAEHLAKHISSDLLFQCSPL